MGHTENTIALLHLLSDGSPYEDDYVDDDDGNSYANDGGMFEIIWW